MAETETQTDEDALSPFLQQVKAPISEDQPTGASVTYDDDFQQLKTQINEIGAASGEASYETIVKLAKRILTEKSKDLRAAGYLVIGAAREGGTEGMAEAVAAVRLLIDTYWEELYPAKRRMRGRGSALQFISDRLGDWIETATFGPSDREPLVAARDDLKAIQDFGLKEMGEHAPAFSGLNKVLERAIRKLPEPEPEPDPEAEADATEEEEEAATPDQPGSEPEPSASSSPPRSQPSAPADIGSEGDAVDAVVKVAAYLRNEDATNPTAYRLMRALRWGGLRKAPSNDGGKTRIPAPREQRRTFLRNLYEQDQYERLLEEGESSFQSGAFHFWLDLQRFVASALEALGKPYAEAHQAVLADTALLVHRLPDLATLTFSDGTPFADPLTADWIETQVQPLLVGDESGSGSSGADGQMAATQQYEEARKTLGSGDLAEALEIMRDGAVQDASQKETFHRQLYIATLCLKGGQPSIAQPLLDDLDAAIERHAIDAWDPPLALEVWTHRCQCYDALAQKAPDADKAELFKQADQAFEKICRVDATRAVSIASRRPR
jgi:type VI secretion system protein VasJ